MSDLDTRLDAKLEDIVIEPIDEFDGLQLSANDIDKIKQAFVDANWAAIPEKEVYDRALKYDSQMVCSTCTHRFSHWEDCIAHQKSHDPTMTGEEWERQAVKDGWVKLPLIRGVKIENEMDVLRLLEDENKFMYEKSINSITGQEFYARFKKEMDNISAGATFDNHDDVDKAYECAKKAAGIE